MKVGIVGAGQLAQMLAHAGEPLGITTHCLAHSLNDPASQVATLYISDFKDIDSIIKFSNSVDVITFENENVDKSLVKLLEKHTPCYPWFKAIEVAQDRLLEKQYLAELNIPVAPFTEINTLEQLQLAAATFNHQCILKTRRFGYDGKGQIRISKPEDIKPAWEHLKNHALILESFIAFDIEVSMVCVRGRSGKTEFYPLARNTHKAGILRESNAPYDDIELLQQAQDYAAKLITALDYVGVLAIEFFVYQGKLIANEVAPRVHNSGHWTIEGAITSQFENHLRAIFDLPLGKTDAVVPTTMFNCIGELPPLNSILNFPDAYFHTYHKAAHENRKLGHVTLMRYDDERFQTQYELLAQLLT